MARLALAVFAALLLASAAPRAALAARSLRQVDGSVRQENAHFKILSALRKGGNAEDAHGSGYHADIGSQNFEKGASWRTMNNVRMNLARYAKPTDGGLRGEVSQRLHAKRDYNDSGDLEDSNYYLEQAAQRNVRLMMVRSERERAGAGKR